MCNARDEVYTGVGDDLEYERVINLCHAVNKFKTVVLS